MATDTAIDVKVTELTARVASEAHHRFGEDITVFWFGSWVAGEAGQRSDIDIALDLPSSVNASQFNSFVDWVDDLPTLYKFDIVNMADISDRFREEITKTGRKI